MPFTLTMPKLSPTMEQGNIVRWYKKEGEFVEADELLLEIGTDKATIEYRTVDEGWLRIQIVKEGEEIAVGAPIAIFTESERESIEGYEPLSNFAEEKEEKPLQQSHQEESEKTAPSSQPPTLTHSEPVFAPYPPLCNDLSSFSSTRKEKYASPLAKKIAKEKNLDLSSVKGSGPNGRVMSRDLDSAKLKDRFSILSKPTHTAGSYENQPLSMMRKAIGQRLQASKSFIPHFYVSMAVNATKLLSLRAELKQASVMLTVNDFILKAVALALEDHPQINSGYRSDTSSLIRFQTIDVAVAVSMEEGLITPIIRHANCKSISQIATEMKALAHKARKGELKPEEYQGGSFTVSNLGMFGVKQFHAIINPPQSAILAVGGIYDITTLRNNRAITEKETLLTVSADHRVLDGAVVAQFLQSIKQYLESPSTLLIGSTT